ncbi:hypothetical protein QJS10_CPA03g00302 [Acorus calamus]|uniref:Uncharacterized protein n=1 Tax=Acorus calamus TaxID=4465 RepID=A0AAV9F4F1_ACOCL|nr:hypothetical protein QJS10_CPA03g00302 [Acorus calamus]
MSAERSFEAWEEMQRHGQDIADRLAQGFNGLLHHSHMSPPSFSWTAPPLKPNKPFDFDLSIPIPSSKWDGLGLGDNPGGINGVSAILDIGSRLGQAGAEFGASLNGVVQQFFRRIPLPFHQDETATLRVAEAGSLSREEGFGSVAEHFRDYGFLDSGSGSDELRDFDEEFGTDLKSSGYFGRSQGSINISSTYDSRTHDIESSLVARGDLWRAEASHGGSNSGNENSPLFLIQLGPVLFVRDTTLLLPVHLSKQHLLWYGFDRKNGMHSLCPAMWSKHRRWLLMSMICLNPLACSFMDLQFPNGQLTYVAGEGLTTSAFLPVFGGLLQAQGHYPGETRFSFSCKNKWGTRITPAVQWPDKSVSLGVVQALAWKRCGLMLRPTIQFSICPTFGGNNPGCHAELIHSIKENLSLISGLHAQVILLPMHQYRLGGQSGMGTSGALESLSGWRLLSTILAGCLSPFR